MIISVLTAFGHSEVKKNPKEIWLTSYWQLKAIIKSILFYGLQNDPWVLPTSWRKEMSSLSSSLHMKVKAPLPYDLRLCVMLFVSSLTTELGEHEIYMAKKLQVPRIAGLCFKRQGFWWSLLCRRITLAVYPHMRSGCSSHSRALLPEWLQQVSLKGIKSRWCSSSWTLWTWARLSYDRCWWNRTTDEVQAILPNNDPVLFEASFRCSTNLTLNKFSTQLRF